MKIVVVHGDDTKKSRARFAQIVSGVKKKGWDVNFLVSDSKTNIGDPLINATLFDSPTLYVIEEAKKLTKQDLDWLSGNSAKFDSQLLIYSLSKLPATTLKAFGDNLKKEVFELPQILFTFLDNFKPQNSKTCLKLFEQLTDSQPMELIIAMLARLLRDLYIALLDLKSLGYPEWRLKKISSQASKFTKLELADIIGELAEIDLKSKTSSVDTRLLVEMLIIKRLG